MKHLISNCNWLLKGALLATISFISGLLYTGNTYAACTPNKTIINSNGDIIKYCTINVTCYAGASATQCLSTTKTRYYFFFEGCTAGKHARFTALGSSLFSGDSYGTNNVESCKHFKICKNNYYSLEDVDTYSVCNTCPTPGSADTSTPAQSGINSCFIDPATSLNDTTGNYNFTNNCYYTP